MFKFVLFYSFMLKNHSREKKIEKHKKSNKSLDAFYSEDQKKEEVIAKHKKTITDTEMEIFEHLKNHTKKILDKNKK